MKDSFDRLRELFERAMELPVERREAFVRDHADDADMAAELLRMLAHGDMRTVTLFATPVDRAAPDTPPTRPSAGSVALLHDPLLREAPVIEGFKVLEPAVLYAKVGQGGMGAVYRGRHFKFDLDVAVKCLKPSLAAESAEYRRRFEREARLAAAIAHQNVVRVMDVQELGELCYIVMEFVRGENARERVSRKGPLPEREALAILLGAASGLAEAHQRGIVHRDVKPDNILISREGDVKLADLGLARATLQTDSQATQTNPAGMLGTPQYMPPEQWVSSDVGAPADVWSLGATLYFLLTGQHAIGSGPMFEIATRIRERPFPEVARLRPDVRPEVQALLRRCVARQPEDRFADASELVNALRPLAPDEQSSLEDLRSGTRVMNEGLATPPPRSTLARIRAACRVAAAETPTPTPAPRSASARGTAVVATLLLLGLGGAFLSGMFDDVLGGSTPRVSPDDAAERRLQEGLSLRQDAGRYEDAIAALEAALSLGREDARLPLAETLAARAAQLETDDPDAALARCRRGVELCAGAALGSALSSISEQVAARCRDVEQALRRRLLAAFGVAEPATDAVLVRSFNVAGPAVTPVVQSVSVALDGRPDAANLPFPSGARSAALADGRFNATMTAPTDGVWFVRVRATDANRIDAERPPVRVLVDTEPPAIDVIAPDAGAKVPGTFRVRGTIRDLTACRLEVCDGPAAIDERGGFDTEVTLPEGRATVRIRATDAADHPQTREQRVVVDTTRPIIDATPIPRFTNGNSLKINGSVIDPGSLSATLMVTVAGKRVEPAADGRFETEVPLPDDGEYRIVIAARDEVGLESETTLTTRRHTVAPVLEPDEPPTRPAAAGKLRVSGRVESALLPDVEIRLATGETADLDGGAFFVDVPFDGREPTTVTLQANDAAGNLSAPLTVKLGASPIATGVGLVVLPVQPGRFQMGSNLAETGRRDDEFPHRVSVGQPFWLGRTEVTRRQWQTVMGTTPWRGQAESLDDEDEAAATHVSWLDAVAFCAALDRAERAAGRIPPGYRYCLPTEAEWEFACRAGRETAFSFGNDAQQLRDHAVFRYESDGRHAHRVGLRQPNPRGFVDMHGNVAEWCADACEWKSRVVTDTYVTDVRDPLCSTGSQRVVRGGSYADLPSECRSAARTCLPPETATPRTGFRVALCAR